MARLVSFVIIALCCVSVWHASLSWVGSVFHPASSIPKRELVTAMHANAISAADGEDTVVPKIVKRKKAKGKQAPPAGGKVSQVGVFSPVVEVAKTVLGEEEFNKFRAEAIKAHTAVITSFVDTLRSGEGRQPTRLSEATMSYLFQLVDADGSGQLDRDEVRKAVEKAGFSWLAVDAKVDQLMEKADADKNALVDFDEFTQTAPTILRQNLVKLAKKNGNYLGFLV